MRVISFNNDTKVDEKVPSLINLDFFTSNQSSLPVEYVPEDKPKKKRRPKKKIIDGQEIITKNEDDSSQLPLYQTNEPYIDTYQETSNMLKSSIYQIDMLQSELKSDIDQIRSSKTLKKKYDYISLLSGTMSSLISTKVNAIREINKTITDSHNLEMKRIKDLKLNAAMEGDDDKRIMDLYTAYISTPVGTYNGPTAYNPPSTMDMTLLNNNVLSTEMYQNMDNNYTVSPAVNRMLLMENPDIKTVVKYETATGNRYFDVINVKTGESVPGIERPDPMFLNDTTIDVRNGIARNINLDQTYTLITIDNPEINKY
jgi:hypothetical protein